MAGTEKTPLFMPILDSVRSEFRRRGVLCPERLPWPLFATEEARRQCEINHGQSPEELARRGGLGIAEAIAILRGERVATGLTDENALPMLAKTLDEIHARNTDPMKHGQHVLGVLRVSQWGASLSREAVRDLLMVVDEALLQYGRTAACVSALELLLKHLGAFTHDEHPTPAELIRAAESEVGSKAPSAQELHDLLVRAQAALMALTDKDALTEPEGETAEAARATLREINETIGSQG